jgi:hypothetical protein
MLKSETSKSRTTSEMKSDPSQSQPSKPAFTLRGTRNTLVALGLLAALLSLPTAASAQSFTLEATAFSPVAVPPEGTSSAIVTVGSVGGFTGTVNLSCQVIPSTFTDPPTCTVSPATVNAPASASATITTKLDTTTIAYAITITGTSGSQTVTTQAQTVTVLAVAPQFTISVTRAVTPTSVPAGNGGQGIVSVNPINGYNTPNGKPGITLSCSSITPLVTIPPICLFTYPNGLTSLPVSGTGSATATITINTFGPVITGAAARPRIFYALWLTVPMLGLVGLGAAVGGKRSGKAWGLLALFVITGALFLMPACSNTSTTTTTPNGVTPNNTYTFTVTGVDSEGNAASNTGSTTTANPSVTLTVTSPVN